MFVAIAFAKGTRGRVLSVRLGFGLGLFAFLGLFRILVLLETAENLLHLDRILGDGLDGLLLLLLDLQQGVFHHFVQVVLRGTNGLALQQTGRTEILLLLWGEVGLVELLFGGGSG